MVMSKFTLTLVVALSLAAGGCGWGKNSNPAAETAEEEMSLAEEMLIETSTDEELEALGLNKKGKKRGAGARREVVVPQTGDEPKQSAPAEQKKPSLGQRIDESIKKNQRRSANSAQRAANAEKARNDMRAVRAMPKSANNLMEANARCEAISAAVNFLKATNSPKKPFAGLRPNFRKVLRAERGATIQAAGAVSCGAIKNMLANLPATAPVPMTPADEVPPASDPGEEVALDPSEV